MIHRNLKQMAMALIAIYTISACSGGDLAGGGAAEKKDPKKKRTEGETTQDSETPSSNDASQPQVVTGAYLACIEDGSATSGNTNFGCTVTNEKDHKKMDLKGKTLNITAADPSGQPIQSKFNRDAETSAFHGHVSVASGAASTAKFTAEFDGKIVKDLRRIELVWREIPSLQYALNLAKQMKNQPNNTASQSPLSIWISTIGMVVNGSFIQKAIAIKNGQGGYTQSEVVAWCSHKVNRSLAKRVPDEATYGAACGAENLPTDGFADILKALGLLKDGICESSAAVGINKPIFDQACKQP